MMKLKLEEKHYKIAAIGNTNLELLVSQLASLLFNIDQNINFTFYNTPFNQAKSELIHVESNLWKFDANYSFFILFFEDFFDPYFQEKYSESAIFQLISEWIFLVKKYAKENKGKTFFLLPMTTVPYHNILNLVKLEKKIHEEFYKHLISDRNITVINTKALFDQHPVKLIDPRLKWIGRFPLSSEAETILADELAHYIISSLGKNIRLLIVDLDNTLWGGILGEDGIAGIHVGSDYPGNCYMGFQFALKHLQSQGVLLSIVSKNDLNIVKKTFEQQEMPLHFDDFISYRINWENKVENIVSIADELNLHLSNILFIDDSRLECESVKTILPEVNVLHLPNDPAYYIEALNKVKKLKRSSLSTSDSTRHQSYKKRQYLQQVKKQFVNIETFYKSLKLHIFFDMLSEKNMNRVAQLFEKTNQFNMTGERYSINELLKLKKKGAVVIAISIKDIFSEKEIMGAMVLDLKKEMDSIWLLENYVLSCRALGKNAEIEIIKAIPVLLKNRNAKQVVFKLIPTERNYPAQKVYEQLKLKPIKIVENSHYFDISGVSSPIADITINDT